MAVTGKGAKSRLDFGAAVDNAFAEDINSQPVSDIQEISDEQVEKIKDEIIETLAADNVSTINKKKDDEDLGNNSEKEECALENNDIVIEQIPSQEISPSVETHKDIVGHTKEDDIFLSLSKNGRGVQSSVYFESDVYEYIKHKADQYNAKFSNVVNLLLKEVIYKD